MTVVLYDLSGADAPRYEVNFWNWRAIVEAIRRLDVLPCERVDALHEIWDPAATLTEGEAKQVAAALRTVLIPTLSDGEYLYINGTRTDELPDTRLHAREEDLWKNYMTTRPALERFASFCEICNGFWVRQ